MIEKILELLALDEYKGQSEIIDFAKGKYKLHTNIKDIRKQAKRNK